MWGLWVASYFTAEALAVNPSVAQVLDSNTRRRYPAPLLLQNQALEVVDKLSSSDVDQ